VDKTFEVEVVRLAGTIANHIGVRITRDGPMVRMGVTADYGSIAHSLSLLPSEAVTIGEQLIAAGKAGE